MPEEYLSLVAAMKSLTQVDGDSTVSLPVAENGWSTRPNTDSYGQIALEFEASASRGDDGKCDMAYEGSFDLYSRDKHGAGWLPYIRTTLTTYCGGSWRMTLCTYEHETKLFHWEWVFQVMD